MQRCEAELIVDASLPRSGTTALLNLLKTLGYETHQNLAKVIRLEEYRPALQLDGVGFNANASASLLSRFVMRGGARKLAFGDIPMHVIACSLATRQAPRERSIRSARSAAPHVRQIRATLGLSRRLCLAKGSVLS